MPLPPVRCRALMSVSLSSLLLLTAGCRPDAVAGPGSPALAGGVSALVTGSSTSASSLNAARSAHVAVPLAGGRVLVAGGVTVSTPLASAELFDPASGRWTTTGSMTFARIGHAAVSLADGRVLVLGGVSLNNCAGAPTGTSAEIYDPATGRWTVTGSLRVPRNSPAIARLADGRVLVAGGGNRCGGVWNSAELYNPATGQWTLTGSMSGARQSAAAVGLADGRVLVAGGIGGFPFASLATAEVYDPGTGTWRVTGSMADPRIWTHEDMAALDNFLALLPDGRVFTAGGINRCDAFGCLRAVLSSAELYDPATGTWRRTGAMAGRRSQHQTTVLPGGRVLVTGGRNNGAPLNTVELYDVAAGTFTAAATLLTARFDHTATRLADGRALVAGGKSTSGLSATEVYGLNRAPVASAGPALTALEGSEVTLDGRGSSDPDGDALAYSWNFSDGSAPASGATASHTYADDGVYSVTLAVSDGSLQATATTTVTVANVAPSVYAFPGGVLLPREAFTATGSFGDPGADSWSATVDYGDGSGVQPLPLSGKSFALGHVYTRAGSYTVTVTVTDDDGGAGVGTATVVVQTPQQAARDLERVLDDLVAAGALKRGNANSLKVKLEAAIARLDHGDAKPAANVFAAFVNEVNALVGSGRLDSAAGQSLLDAVQRIVTAVEGEA